MIKLSESKKAATPEQEKRVWNYIDYLYAQLERGEATEDELRLIDDISQIIMEETTAHKQSQELVAQKTLAKLARKDASVLMHVIGTAPHQTKKTTKQTLYRHIARASVGIAASILLVLGISHSISDGTIFGIKNAMASSRLIQCENDSVVHLPDGTTIHLAGGSHLAVDRHFGKKDRVVSLTGEAFFDVAKDKERAFIVQTKEVNTIVHGTSFNIIAYEGTIESQVLVSTGCVEVTRGTKTFGKFYRGDRVVYNQTANVAHFDKVSPENIGHWMSGGFILEDATVEELKIKMKSRFDKELTIEQDAIPADARVNFRSYKPGQTEATDVLRSLCTVYGAHYSTDGNRIVISR